MKVEKIKPIPKYILKRIEKADKTANPSPCGITRYYSYLSKNDGELVKITVAVRHKYSKWYYKQVAVHGIHSDKCFVKDMAFFYLGGYTTGWFAEGLSKYQKWYEDDEWGWSEDKYFNVYAPTINPEYIHKLPEYKYSAWEQRQEDIFAYLRRYEKYPQLEYLTKAGLQRISTSTTILKRTQKDKKFCKWLMANRKKIQNNFYYVDVIMKAYTSGQDIDELQRAKKFKLELQHNETYRTLAKTYDEETTKRIVQYVFEQNISFPTYRDYLRACEYLELDMTEDKNMFPHDFNHWHDIRSDEYRTAKAMKDAQERQKLYEHFALIANKYLMLEHNKKSAYISIIAKSPAELKNEGEALHHCVGRMGYDQKFVREESLIFFIRLKEKPNIPFITVEYSPSTRKILQIHGMNNSAPDEATKNYIERTWLPYANRHIKAIAA